MRILYVSDRLNANDGSAVHGREFVKAARSIGCAVATLPEIAQNGASKPGKMKRAWRSAKRRVRRVSGLAGSLLDLLEGWQRTLPDLLRGVRLVRTFEPDVIIFRQSLFNYAPILLGKAAGIPLVAEVNAVKRIEKGTAADRLVATAEGVAFRSADRIFAVSSEVAEELQRYGLRRPVEVVANGVDVDRFDPERIDRTESKRRLGLEGKVVIGYVGSFQQWHGVDRLLEIVERLREGDERYHLMLIGDGAERKRLGERIAGERWQGWVTQAGQVTHGQMPSFLAAIDYAPMPYRPDAAFYFSPLKMYEYLAMGVIAVAPRVGQLVEVLKHRESGWLVEVNEVAAFVAAIRALEADPALSDAMRRQARQLILRHYSWEQNARKVVGLCRGLVPEQRLSGVNLE